VLRSILWDDYLAFKKDIIDRKEQKGKRKASETNQEGDNLSKQEKAGLNKLRKRIKSGEIIVIKTDKSGKLGVVDRQKYLEMGRRDSAMDRIVERHELKQIEKRLNDHTRMILKIVNAGEAHGHLDRINNSKITNSETAAPKYFLYKDHKKVESWRPVVSGCNSNTLGLSNLLSDLANRSAIP